MRETSDTETGEGPDGFADRSTAQTGTASRRTGAWTKLAVLLGSTLLVLLAVELGFRVLGADYDRPALEAKIASFVNTMTVGQLEGEEQLSGTEGRILHPYHAWEILNERTELQGDYFATLDELAAPAEAEASQEAFEVWVVGGSVARYFADPESGAAQFAAVLEASPRFAGRDVVVKNHGRIAMKQPQQAFLVQYLMGLGMEPDLLVNLDGFNETAIANENVVLGTHPVYPSADMWSMISTDHENDGGSLDRMLALYANRRECARIGAEAVGSGLLWSHAYAYWVEGRLTRLQHEYIERRADYLEYVGSRPNNLAARGISFAGYEERVPEMIERVWSESSRLLAAVCADRGVEYLHVLQPTLHDEGSKPLTEDEVRTGAAADSWIEGVRFGYPLLRAAGERLRDEHGVWFLDASQVFREAERTLYYDACHFNFAGNWALGDFLAKAYLAGEAGPLAREAAGAQPNSQRASSANRITGGALERHPAVR